MKKHFNVAGPCIPDRHYMLSAIDRNKQIENLIEYENFFVIHAARQSGKTTVLQQFTQKINSEGNYYALYCSLESVQTFSQPEKGIPEIVNSIEYMVKYSKLPNKELFGKNLDKTNITTLLRAAISEFCALLDKPFIIFFDEADCLSDDTLISFLRQMRDGYINRGTIPFLHSCALVGMRNIRDYKNNIRKPWHTLGSASPFNVITKALTLTNFSIQQIESLYEQHTQLTGQRFEKEAVEKIFFYTKGQPWLVNAIARECIAELLQGNYSLPITAQLVEQAKENIILRRDTHIDSLLERLKEERVRNVVEPIILGKEFEVFINEDDTQYCIDLGLIEKGYGILLPSNNIYKEVIIRALTYDSQFYMQNVVKNVWINEAGLLNMNSLLKGFQEFWRKNSAIWVEKFEYKEAAPHLILQAFLQRIINGGGSIDREYSSGRRRIDLCVHFAENQFPIELKILYNNETIPEGIVQLAGYMDTLNCKEGWLIVFDRSLQKNWEEKIYWKTETVDNKTIHLVGA